jgi:hypothetical protein
LNKVLGAGILLGFLMLCWRRSRGTAGLVGELVLLPLVYLLAAPVSNRYHFALAVLPLAYLWVVCRQAGHKAELVALAAATLVLGTAIPDYVAVSIPFARQFFVALSQCLWVAATTLLVWVGARLFNPSQAALRADFSQDSVASRAES